MVAPAPAEVLSTVTLPCSIELETVTEYKVGSADDVSCWHEAKPKSNTAPRRSTENLEKSFILFLRINV